MKSFIMSLLAIMLVFVIGASTDSKADDRSPISVEWLDNIPDYSDVVIAKSCFTIPDNLARMYSKRECFIKNNLVCSITKNSQYRHQYATKTNKKNKLKHKNISRGGIGLIKSVQKYNMSNPMLKTYSELGYSLAK